MEVTRDNFLKAYDILEQEIEDADFIAIDGEFTGLSTLKYKRPGYDTLDEFYSKTRVGTGQMMLIQYGICLFTWKEEDNQYEAMPFTFYIFPRPYKKYGNEVMFMSQSTSLDFLSKNNFDFNKLFHKGISYMTPFSEEKARERIEREMSSFIEKEQQSVQKSGVPPGVSSVFIPKDQREFMESIIETVTNFMKDESQIALDLPPSNPFQRKLIYEKMEETYPVGLYLECATAENQDKFIRCHKTAMGLKKLQEEKTESEQKILDDVLGFSKVMKLLTKWKKPIIGHNMLLDLFLTTTTFYGPPQLCLRDFKEFVSNIYPVVFDTKLIASTPPVSQMINHTSLAQLVGEIDKETLPKSNVIICEKLKGEGEFQEEYHSAGYDAYCTGRIFLSLSKCVLSCLTQPSDRVDLSCDLLSQYINRVFVMGIRDIRFTDLSNEDSTPDRQNVFYIRFPKNWKQAHIEDLFFPYCTLSYPINWINEESAFVTISDEGSYDDIFVNLVMNSGKEYYILPYNDYINNSDPRKRVNSSSEVVPAKRKRADSDMEDGEISS